MSKKDVFTKELDAQMDLWNAEIEEFKEIANKAKADARAQYAEDIKKLEEKRDAAQSKIQALRQASDDAWEDLKARTDIVWSDLSSAMDSAHSRFKHSIFNMQ